MSGFVSIHEQTCVDSWADSVSCRFIEQSRVDSWSNSCRFRILLVSIHRSSLVSIQDRVSCRFMIELVSIHKHSHADSWANSCRFVIKLVSIHEQSRVDSWANSCRIISELVSNHERTHVVFDLVNFLQICELRYWFNQCWKFWLQSNLSNNRPIILSFCVVHVEM